MSLVPSISVSAAACSMAAPSTSAPAEGVDMAADVVDEWPKQVRGEEKKRRRSGDIQGGGQC